MEQIATRMIFISKCKNGNNMLKFYKKRNREMPKNPA